MGPPKKMRARLRRGKPLLVYSKVHSKLDESVDPRTGGGSVKKSSITRKRLFGACNNYIFVASFPQDVKWAEQGPDTRNAGGGRRQSRSTQGNQKGVKANKRAAKSGRLISTDLPKMYQKGSRFDTRHVASSPFRAGSPRKERKWRYSAAACGVWHTVA